MLKKTITYTDFNDREVTEDFYFHLSQAELVDMQYSKDGGLEKWIKNISDKIDAAKAGGDEISAELGREIMAEYAKLIGQAIGQKSEDGKTFLKSDRIRDGFTSSPAYDVLFMELVTDGDKGAEFVNGVVPRQLNEKMAAIAKRHPSDTAAQPAPIAATSMGAPSVEETETVHNVHETHGTRVLSRQEMMEMDAAELKTGLATGKYSLPQ